MSTIAINASVEVIDRAAEPLRMTQSVATLDGPNGERIEVLTGFPVPLTLVLRGERLVGTINLEPLIQEAALHVLKANAKEVGP